jgi:hypothetical protein
MAVLSYGLASFVRPTVLAITSKDGSPYQWVPGRDLDAPRPRSRGCCWSGSRPASCSGRPSRPSSRLLVTARETGIRGRHWPRSSLGSPPPRLGIATASCGSRPRNLYNLVATGALDHRQVDHALLGAAERCGLLAEEPRQTHRTLASGRQVGLAHPGRPRQPTSPERTHTSLVPPTRTASERTKEGR